MMRVVLAVLSIAGAAACGSTDQMTYRELDELSRSQQREAISRPPPDSCQMAEHRHLIGQPVDTLEDGALPDGARVICHDCDVTLDYRPARLNIELGPNRNIQNLRCG